MNKTQEQARKLIKTAARLGWQVHVRDEVLTIAKGITPNDHGAFAKADAEWYAVLSLARQTRPGSTWGTDGGGVGACSAMRSGTFVMNRSGVSKRFLTTLRKELDR